MRRFLSDKKKPAGTGTILASAVVFLMIAGFVLYALSGFSHGSDERQLESLERALNRDITYCYATEGRYPADLDYIKTHYGLTWDERRFYIDYRVIASNLYPDVTILILGKDGVHEAE